MYQKGLLDHSDRNDNDNNDVPTIYTLRTLNNRNLQTGHLLLHDVKLLDVLAFGGLMWPMSSGAIWILGIYISALHALNVKIVDMNIY